MQHEVTLFIPALFHRARYPFRVVGRGQKLTERRGRQKKRKKIRLDWGGDGNDGGDGTRCDEQAELRTEMLSHETPSKTDQRTKLTTTKHPVQFSLAQRTPSFPFLTEIVTVTKLCLTPVPVIVTITNTDYFHSSNHKTRQDKTRPTLRNRPHHTSSSKHKPSP